MRVLFSEISSTGSRYRLDVVNVSPVDKSFRLQGPVDFNCTLSIENGGGVLLQGVIAASLLLRCDRCLDMVAFQVQSEMSLSFVVEDGDRRQIKDIELPVADLDIIELSEPVIDLEEVAVQQLDFNLPVKHLCETGCRGICSGCGVNLNRGDCGCSEDVGNNPFAVLAELKE